ncbi:efflux RND transporter periplasmic adaptor subunit [Singulisphaera sp. PoT]|uniref:efflux RND transporter periplasmic adaptor subunit n=1 Tax=Singulisphaera sp. PoT TaxID=3411797 RepID=UPI003BF60114
MGGTLGVLATGYFGLIPAWKDSQPKDATLSLPVTRGTLRIVVTERGNLESVKTVDGICDLPGYQNKIIQLTPEGTHVEKGQVVCRFDSAEIDKNVAQQEIKAKQSGTKIETSLQEVEIAKNKGESEIIAAKVELELAVLDLEMYQKGTYVFETEEIRGDIGLKVKKVQESKNTLDQFQGLVKKGFRSLSDLRAAQSELEGNDLTLTGAKAKLMVKEKYEYKRKSTEYSSKVDQAKKKVSQALATAKASVAKAQSEYEAAKATFAIEDQQLKEYQKNKGQTEIKAEQAGIVAYANDSWYDSSRQIREGATVYSRQKIFSLPDLTSMQVKVNIHESLIKKIKPGQLAEIRVDAFPNLVIVGKVKTVSQLADSNRGWMSGGVKEYTTVVGIEQMPKEELRPGMTSEVKILVGEVSNVLMIPVQAVAQHKGKFYAFAQGPKGFERREVGVGDTNEFQVQVISGLKEGETVALDARSRVAAEFKDEEKEQALDPNASKKATSPAAK